MVTILGQVSTLALLTSLLVAGGPQPTRSLAGFKYIVVVPPVYEGGPVDMHGFGRHLEDQLAAGGSWVVLSPGSDRSRDSRDQISQTLIATLTHTYAMTFTNSATVDFYDVVGDRIYTARRSATSWGTTPDGDVRNAISAIVRDLRQMRPRFDQAQVVDIVHTLPPVDTVSMSELEFAEYLRANRRRLRGLEGVWVDDKVGYRLGVMRDSTAATDAYLAFVLRSQSPFWDPHMVKWRLEGTSEGGVLVGTYFMNDHRPTTVTATLSDGVLVIPFERAGQRDTALFRQVDRGSSEVAAEAGGPAGAYRFSGTGWVCGRGLVVTNYHVAEHAKGLRVEFAGRPAPYDARVAVADKANDLVILRVVDDSGGRATCPPALKVRVGRALRLGQEVYVIGFPLGELLGAGHKVTTGVISATSGLGDDPRMVQLTVPVQPGSSGGPVLDEHGEVVGVLSATLSPERVYQRVGSLPQNVNFAVKADYLQTLLWQVEGVDLGSVVDVSALPREAQIDRVRGSVGRILVAE